MPQPPTPELFAARSAFERAAFDFAAAAHAAMGQHRKYSDEPYVVHPVAVAELVRTVPHTEAMIAAALLHDVVEDTEIRLPAIEAHFGGTVAELVDWLTDVSRPEDGNRRVRKRLDLEHLARAPAAAQTINYADLIDNSHSISAYDRGFWPVFRREMRDLIAALDRGDASLRQHARTIAEGANRTKATASTRGEP